MADVKIQTILFDSTSVRRDRMELALRSAGLVADSIKTFWPDNHPPPERCKATQLWLIHFSERDKLNGLLPASRWLAVYYGGDVEKDPEWETRPNPKESDEWIWRPVHRDGNGALSTEEAKALIEYAKRRATDVIERPEFLNPPNNTNKAIPNTIGKPVFIEPPQKVDESLSIEIDKPSFLKPPVIPHVLTALSILCPGFLMRLQLPPIENEKDGKKEIHKSAFLNVFGNENVNTIIDNAKKEWKSLSSKADFDEDKFRAVENFIKAATSGNPQMETTVITNAYLALKERLGAVSGY